MKVQNYFKMTKPSKGGMRDLSMLMRIKLQYNKNTFNFKIFKFDHFCPKDMCLKIWKGKNYKTPRGIRTYD